MDWDLIEILPEWLTLIFFIIGTASAGSAITRNPSEEEKAAGVRRGIKRVLDFLACNFWYAKNKD